MTASERSRVAERITIVEQLARIVLSRKEWKARAEKAEAAMESARRAFAMKLAALEAELAAYRGQEKEE